MNYTDVFGSDTLPPSEYGYKALTFAASETLFWPYNYSGSGNTVAKLMECTASAGSLALTLPDARQVSTGEDVLVRNVGANAFDVKDASGATITNVAAGVTKYLFLTANTTLGGTWHVVTFGTGTSSADASALAGYGLKVTSATLSQAHPVVSSSAASVTIDATYRAKVLSLTGGAATVNLTAAATVGDDFFLLLRNDGTGIVTIDPSAAELVDGAATLSLNPTESLLLVCDGAAWHTIGRGYRPPTAASQLLYDVTSGGPFTLTSADSANQLIKFIGTPASSVTVNGPNTVAVYQLQNATTQTVVFKTAYGTGVSVPAGNNIAVKCDGTNMVNALDITITGNTPDFIVQSYGVI